MHVDLPHPAGHALPLFLHALRQRLVQLPPITVRPCMRQRCVTRAHTRNPRTSELASRMLPTQLTPPPRLAMQVTASTATTRQCIALLGLPESVRVPGPMLRSAYKPQQRTGSLDSEARLLCTWTHTIMLYRLTMTCVCVWTMAPRRCRRACRLRRQRLRLSAATYCTRWCGHISSLTLQWRCQPVASSRRTTVIIATMASGHSISSTWCEPTLACVCQVSQSGGDEGLRLFTCHRPPRRETRSHQ